MISCCEEHEEVRPHLLDLISLMALKLKLKRTEVVPLTVVRNRNAEVATEELLDASSLSSGESEQVKKRVGFRGEARKVSIRQLVHCVERVWAHMVRTLRSSQYRVKHASTFVSNVLGPQVEDRKIWTTSQACGSRRVLYFLLYRKDDQRVDSMSLTEEIYVDVCSGLDDGPLCAQ